MGCTWAGVWSLAGGATHWLLGITTDLPLPLLFGGLGFLAGVASSVVLLVTARRRSFDGLSLPAFATGGALVGAVFGALFVLGVSYGLTELIAIPAAFVCAGAASAAGSLAMARRASPTALPPESRTLSLDETT